SISDKTCPESALSGFFLVYSPFGFLPARGVWRRDTKTGTGYQLTEQGRCRKPQRKRVNDRRE
ncbi:hypothetical protein AB6846_23405, partial [Serratia proteamaculans]